VGTNNIPSGTNGAGTSKTEQSSGTPAVRPELAEARAKVAARIAEIDAELAQLAKGSWEQQGASRPRMTLLRREKEVLTMDFLKARLDLDEKGEELERGADKIIGESQQAMTQDARSRHGFAAGLNAFQQVGASTLEGGLALGALTGRLLQLDGVASAEHAMMHPLHTAAELGKGVGRHIRDTYEANGACAAAGDAASLVVDVAADVRIAGAALEGAAKLTRPLAPAIARGVENATLGTVSSAAAMPAAQGAVKVVVAVEVGKEGAKLGALTAGVQEVGADVREKNAGKDKKDPR